MAATKTAKTLLASQTLAAGASVNVTEWDMRTAYAGSLLVRITNGASGPTTAPLVTFYSGETSGATGAKRTRFAITGDTTNSSVRDIECEYLPQHMFANCTIQNGTGQAITVEAYGQELTTI